MRKPYIVIDLGGSLVMKDEVRVDFLSKFRPFILRYLKKGYRFIIISGGGKICRHYLEAARKIVKLGNNDLDWLGIYVTRLNAQFLRAIFSKEAYPHIIDEFEMPVKGEPKLLIGAGVRPGWSTDYVAVMLAHRFKAAKIIIAGTYDGIYDMDFEKYPKAKRLDALTWKNYKRIIGGSWKAGARAPVDPVAAKYAEKEKMTLNVLKAENLPNFAKCIEGKAFEGTVIK